MDESERSFLLFKILEINVNRFLCRKNQEKEKEMQEKEQLFLKSIKVKKYPTIAIKKLL
jgi:hypothetical protein